jgi:hypothetical protein
VTYLIEYLGELEFMFETVLGYISGEQMGYFEAKKTESKISCLGTLKPAQISGLVVLPPNIIIPMNYSISYQSAATFYTISNM